MFTFISSQVTPCRTLSSKLTSLKRVKLRNFSSLSVCYNDNNYADKPNIYKNQQFTRNNSTINSVIQSQTGIFKTISESAPVECLQNLLIYSHNLTGLPWWATIVGTTIILRVVVTFPLALYQHYIMAKLELIKMEMPDIVKELKKETALAIKLYNWDEKTAKITYNRSIRRQWNKLIVRENCHPFKASLLLLVQIPMWVSLSVAVRNLVYMLPNRDIFAQITYTELTLGGLGWIPNLTEVDASFILPVTFGLINLLIIELQTLSKVTVPTKTQKYMTYFFRGITVCMIPIAASVPSALVLYWTTSSAVGLAQNLILLSPKVKRFSQIPKTPSELEEPYKQILVGLQHRLSFNKT